MGLEFGRGLGQSGVRRLGSKRRMDGVGAVGGRHVRLVSVAAASRGTQTRRGMGLGNKRNTTTIGYARRSIN